MLSENTEVNDRIKKCISCDSSNFSFYKNHKVFNLPIYICNNCKLYVLGTLQDELDTKLNHYYDSEFWEKTNSQIKLDDNFSDDYSKGRIRIWQSQFKYCKTIIKKNIKILEIGSGHGEAIYNFDQLGFKVVGIEPDKKNVLNINKKLKQSKCILGNAETFELNQKFDLIWMNHVFEHLSKPIEILEKCKKFLNNMGHIFIEVPSVEKINDYRTFTITPHAYNYSKLALENICKKSNYSIIKCDYFRSPTMFEGGINKIFKNIYKFYPKILTDKNCGENIRIILQKS